MKMLYLCFHRFISSAFFVHMGKESWNTGQNIEWHKRGITLRCSGAWNIFDIILYY